MKRLLFVAIVGLTTLALGLTWLWSGASRNGQGPAFDDQPSSQLRGDSSAGEASTSTIERMPIAETGLSGLLLTYQAEPVSGCPYRILYPNGHDDPEEAETGPHGEWSVPDLDVVDDFILEFEPFEQLWVRFPSELLRTDRTLKLPELLPIVVTVDRLPEGGRWSLFVTPTGRWKREPGVAPRRWRYPQQDDGIQVELGLKGRTGVVGQPLLVYGVANTPLQLEAGSYDITIPQPRQEAYPGSHVLFAADPGWRTVTVTVVNSDGAVASVAGVVELRSDSGHTKGIVRNGSATMTAFLPIEPILNEYPNWVEIPLNEDFTVFLALESGEWFRRRVTGNSLFFPRAELEFALGDGQQPWTLQGEGLDRIWQPLVIDREGNSSLLDSWDGISVKRPMSYVYSVEKGLVVSVEDHWERLFLMRNDGAISSIELNGPRESPLQVKWEGEVTQIAFDEIVNAYALGDVTLGCKAQVSEGSWVRGGARHFTRDALLSNPVEFWIHPTYQSRVMITGSNAHTRERVFLEFQLDHGGVIWK